MRVQPLEPSVGLPTGPRSAVLSGEAHASAAIGAFDGNPFGDAKRSPGWGSLMRVQPMGLSLSPHGAPKRSPGRGRRMVEEGGGRRETRRKGGRNAGHCLLKTKA
jgi:hypothetical protein